MKRFYMVAAPLAVTALMLAACGSDAPKTLSEDDFVTQMNSICRTADRAFNKLDPTDKSYYDDGSDIIQTALDDFAELKAPKSLKDDFDDFTANLTDFQDEIGNLGDAIKDEDQEAAQKASDKLDKLSKDIDDDADAIGADRCVDVGGGGGTTDTTEPATTDAPETTELETTAPETTEPDTTDAPDTTDSVPETTDTPNTPLSIDTTPDTVEPPSTTGGGSSGDVVASDASLEFSPIAGYTWGTLEDVPGTVTPSGDPVLGPLLDSYYVGVMENSTDGTPVYLYLTVLDQDTDWTQEQLDAYYAFELVADGTDATTPSGFPARVKSGVVEGYDGGVFTIPGFGVSILAPSGADILGLLDAFGQAQAEMGG